MIERFLKALMDRGLVKEPTVLHQASWDPVAPRERPSMACDLLVIAVGPEGSQIPAGVTAIDWMLRAALLVELRLEGRAVVSGSGRRPRRRCVTRRRWEIRSRTSRCAT